MTFKANPTNLLLSRKYRKTQKTLKQSRIREFENEAFESNMAVSLLRLCASIGKKQSQLRIHNYKYI